MGEVAALQAAFDAEFSKALSSLPAVSPSLAAAHDAHLNHHRATIKVAELVAYYSSRLPPWAVVQRVLRKAEQLVQKREYALARDSCFAWVKSQALHLQEDVQRMDGQSRLQFHIQACFGVATCDAELVLQADPQIKQPDTLKQLVSCLDQLKEALALVLPVEGAHAARPCNRGRSTPGSAHSSAHCCGGCKQGHAVWRCTG